MGGSLSLSGDANLPCSSVCGLSVTAKIVQASIHEHDGGLSITFGDSSSVIPSVRVGSSPVDPAMNKNCRVYPQSWEELTPPLLMF